MLLKSDVPVKVAPRPQTQLWPAEQGEPQVFFITQRSCSFLVLDHFLGNIEASNSRFSATTQSFFDHLQTFSDATELLNTLVLLFFFYLCE